MVEKYLWSSIKRLLSVFDENGNLIMRFNYADDRVPYSMEYSGQTYYLVYDQIGSLRAVVDSSGLIIKRIDYDSFGNVILDTNPSFKIPIGFAGGLYDPDTGLVRFGMRDYDPAIGRWTAKDPIDFAGGSVNLYEYVLNDPVNWFDPWGLDPIVINPPGNWNSSTPPGEVNPVLRCHVNPHRDPIENLIGAGIIFGGIGVAMIPEAAVTTYPYVVSAGRLALIQTLANPGLIQNAADFIQGAFVPGPPPPSIGGYMGLTAKELADKINEIRVRYRNNE